jgi:hypothetical protein
MWPFSRRKTAGSDGQESLDEADSEQLPLANEPSQQQAQRQQRDLQPAAPSQEQEGFYDPAKMPRPHRCNARVEDLVQVRLMGTPPPAAAATFG